MQKALIIQKITSGNIARLYSDLRDGLYLLKIEDEVKPGVVNWTRVHKSYDKWQRHMKVNIDPYVFCL